MLRHEKSAFIECFGSLKAKHADFTAPALTFIVAQRDSGFRLIPSRPNPNARGDADRNIQPGTCVSKQIVSPVLEQFILFGQKAIQVG